ncbi:hypothetical protein ACO0RG_004121 [Hanseniaspora osmophila]|uniref:Mitochondrial phosphate carrier protein 2 n=1 Tax=Hanseniaspora osmophila TaxID=56408 RepID=A0A1E5RAM9_9ASCO|nr:Mitochondrial phosphate carrier protein 2 [Hanseniaspora osmophila]
MSSHKIELYSPEYFKYSFIGGILACAPTHGAVTAIDTIKCRLQVDSHLYKSNLDGFKKIISQDGFGALYTGGAATFLGYGLQGFGKYGFYELFKYKYGEFLGKENAEKYRTSLYLASSASAEFIADILLCPFEAVKVRQQTTLDFKQTKSFVATWKEIAQHGGLYSGLGPLWFRQIPYTMVKFTTFEKIVEYIYDYFHLQKNKMNKFQQASVSFAGGFIAGVMCAIVSNPADVMVSKINHNKLASESTSQAVKREYAKIGFKGLWSGLPMRIVMISSLTSFQWLIFDSFKISVGLPSTGGH